MKPPSQGRGSTARKGGIVPPASDAVSSVGNAGGERFPVVAIGGSAGALAGFKELVGVLPHDTGMAFVILQHLDPHHDSTLAEMLEKAGKLPFELAQPDQKIEPNHGYVLPPGKQMAMAGNRLQIAPRAEGRFLPIDHFMESLAEERGAAAIGVVLSGTAGDGTRGLMAIKAHDGITFAQDATALFQSMPEGAISTGAVDFVLPPAEIGRKLVELAGRTGIGAAAKARQARKHEPELETIFAALRAAHGMDFSGYKPSFVQRRIRRRMDVNGVRNLAGYAEFLKSHAEETEALRRDLLITVSGFFRDPEVFETLKREVFPRIVGSRRTPIRIWVPGCAAGQEAYSLAIALDEFQAGAAQPPVLIFGTDASQVAIEQARAGLYADSIASEVTPERLRHYFTSESPHGYRIAKVIRDRCVFACHNLGADPPLSNMNLVSCRNTLIYFDSRLQEKALAQLYFSLRPDGFLILGASEGGPAAARLFISTDRAHRIYRPQPDRPRANLGLATGQPPAAPARADRTAPVGSSEAVTLAQADRLVLAEYAPAGVVVDARLRVVQFRGRTGPYLESAPGRASLDLFKMARPEIAAALREAVEEAKRSGAPARRDSAPSRRNGGARTIRCDAIPLPGGPEEGYLLVLFRPMAPTASAPHGPVSPPGAEELRLQRELAAADAALRAARLEQTEAPENFEMAQEEAASANEELMAANEELETSKEELQALNEELHTLNDELRIRNADMHHAEEFSKAVFDAISEPLLVLDEKLCVSRANESFYAYFHASERETVGKSFADIGHGQWDTAQLRGLLERARPGELLRGFELEREDPEQGRRLLSVTARRVVEAPSRKPALLVVFDDITERRRAQDRMRAQIDYLTSAASAFFLVDNQERVIFANAAAEAMTGYSTGELAGQILHDKIHAPGSGDPLTASSIYRAVTGGQKVATLEEVFTRHGGETFTARCVIAQLFHNGAPAGVAIEMHDSDNEGRVARSLLASERMAMSGQLVASMAHEINNPLGAITNAMYGLTHLAKLEDPAARHKR